MKRRLLLCTVVVLAGCSCADERERPPSGTKGTPSAEANLEELWTWERVGVGTSRNLETDHGVCDVAKGVEDRSLLEVRQYIDCMVAKGWQQDTEGWDREAERRMQEAAK